MTAHVSGRQQEKGVFMEQPQDGVPHLVQGQLLRAKKASCGFAETERHFWLALPESLVREGWRRSLSADAFFTSRRDSKLVAMAATHVDAMLLARFQKFSREEVLSKVSAECEWKLTCSFTFHCREKENGISVMKNTESDGAHLK